MAPALPHSPGCRHAHEAPSFTELVLATDALDAVIGDTFGPGVLRAVQKQQDNPLDQDGHTAAIRTVLRRILAVVTPADQRSESRLLLALDRDWKTMTETQRDKAISLAMGAIVDAGRVVAPRVGNVLEAAGRTHVTDTRGAITDRYALAIDPSFSAVDQKVLAHMASSQALFIRDAYGRRAASDSVLARRIAVAGVSRGLDSTDIGEAMTKAFRGTSAERSESYFRMVASVFMGRARSYATVTGFIEAQIELSEISSALVETTCDACRMLDGTVFSVSEQHRSFLDVASQEDPEEVKFRQPFVSKGKDADGEYLYFKDRGGSRQQVARVTESGVGKKDEKGSYKPSLSAKQLGAKGVSTPPFHGHCLCLLIPAGLETVQQASSAARAGRPTEVPVGPKAPSVPAPPGEGVAPERAPRRRRTPADPPTLDRLPTRSGRFTVDLSLLDAAPYSNFVPGRVESIRDALDRGKKLPPIQIVVDASGRLSISDGNHRLRVYRERGVGPVPVDFVVWRTAGSWALREERARRRAQGDTAVPAIAPSAPPVKPPKAPPAPPVAPPTPAPKPKARVPVDVVKDNIVGHLQAHGLTTTHDRNLESRIKGVFPDGMPSIPTLEKTWGGGAGGHEIKINFVHMADANAVQFTGEIRKDGKAIGDITRTFHRHADGSTEVHHDYFKIGDTSQQGKGVGETMLRQAIQTYETLGYQKITVDTAWVGRYAWATFGYNWGPTKATEVATKLADYLEGQGVEPGRAKLIAKGASKRSWDVAALDVDGITTQVTSEGEKITCKLGKAFLLSGRIGWSGALVLDKKHPTYKRAKERLGL